MSILEKQKMFQGFSDICKKRGMKITGFSTTNARFSAEGVGSLDVYVDELDKHVSFTVTQPEVFEDCKDWFLKQNFSYSVGYKEKRYDSFGYKEEKYAKDPVILQLQELQKRMDKSRNREYFEYLQYGINPEKKCVDIYYKSTSITTYMESITMDQVENWILEREEEERKMEWFLTELNTHRKENPTKGSTRISIFRIWNDQKGWIYDVHCIQNFEVTDINESVIKEIKKGYDDKKLEEDLSYEMLEEVKKYDSGAFLEKEPGEFSPRNLHVYGLKRQIQVKKDKEGYIGILIENYGNEEEVMYGTREEMFEEEKRKNIIQTYIQSLRWLKKVRMESLFDSEKQNETIKRKIKVYFGLEQYYGLVIKMDNISDKGQLMKELDEFFREQVPALIEKTNKRKIKTENYECVIDRRERILKVTKKISA